MAGDFAVKILDQRGEVRLDGVTDRCQMDSVVVAPADVPLQFLVSGCGVGVHPAFSGDTATNGAPAIILWKRRDCLFRSVSADHAGNNMSRQRGCAPTDSRGTWVSEWLLSVASSVSQIVSAAALTISYPQHCGGLASKAAWTRLPHARQ